MYREELDMIKKNWMMIAVLLLSLLALAGYCVYDGVRTDSTAPEITVSAEVLEVSVHDGKDALLQGITAADDRDGDVTASVVAERVSAISDANEVTVTYAAFDSSGNVAKTNRTVRYTDYESLQFTLNRPLAFYSGTSFDLLAAIQAEDMVDGDISYRIKATSMDETSVSAVGNHTVRFRVTNSMGDTVELTLPVEVYTERYNAQLTLTDYLVYIKAGDRFDAAEYLDEFTVREDVLPLNGNVPAGVVLRTMGYVDTEVPGVYALSMTMTQEQGSLEYVGYTRLIVVVEE